MSSPTPELRIAMVGHSFMGAAHSAAWRTVGHVFPLPLQPRMQVLVGRRPTATVEAAARLGWQETSTDWRTAVTRDDIDVVDIVTPGDSHAEIALAALAAGKHVLCEKPLANTVEQARRLAAAAAVGPGLAMVGFNYRRVPALALAHELIAAGRIGTVRHVRAQYLQDWLVDPLFPLAWRLQAERSGSGALGDLGAHIVDLAEFLTGSTVSSVCGLTETFVTSRPLPAAAGAGLTGVGGTEQGAVTVDDAALFVARFAGGIVGTFEATRFASGRKNAMAIEINGSKGTLAFELESLNELTFFEGGDDPATEGFRRILVTESVHPYLQAWWPPGHIIGWEHSFTHEMRDLVVAIAAGTPVRPDFADGLRVQKVLQAVEDSARDRRWVDIAEEKV
jgi:predicted dehydrogenase